MASGHPAGSRHVGLDLGGTTCFTPALPTAELVRWAVAIGAAVHGAELAQWAQAGIVARVRAR